MRSCWPRHAWRFIGRTLVHDPKATRCSIGPVYLAWVCDDCGASKRVRESS